MLIILDESKLIKYSVNWDEECIIMWCSLLDTHSIMQITLTWQTNIPMHKLSQFKQDYYDLDIDNAHILG